MSDRSALELAESSEWAALHRMVSAHPVRAEELDDFGMMPLHWACTDTHVPLRAVKVLADAFPEATVLRNKGGLVPLHIAVKANTKTDVLRALVAARDDALVEETPAGETPAELAVAVGLAHDKVAFLAHAEQQLRASGRAPPRSSDRYKSLLALQQQQQQNLADADEEEDDENLALNSNRSRRGSVASNVDSGWVLTGTNANSLSSAAGMTSVGQLRAPPSSAVALPPRWRLDNRCNICQVKFSYFKTRHHCRSCGESVCSTHSSHRVLIKHSAFTTPQRVCILCYDEMRETGKPASAVVNMYANPSKDDSTASNEVGDARGRKGRSGKDAPAVRSHHHRSHDSQQQQRGGPLLRPTRSVLSLTTTTAIDSSSPLDRHPNALAAAANSARFDDEAEHSRPRAWTEMDATENFAQMQNQVRELHAHRQELQLSKQRLELQLAVGAREVTNARQERLANEYAVAEIRKDRMLDISRLPLEDDPNVLRVDDDDDSEDDEDGAGADGASVDAALTCNYLGMALFEKGEFASAILEFRKSVGLNASDPDVWYNLARALHGAGEFYDAEIAVRRALGMTSRSYALLALLGKILHSKGEDDKSIEVFREALGLMDHGEDSDSDDDVGSATVGW